MLNEQNVKLRLCVFVCLSCQQRVASAGTACDHKSAQTNVACITELHFWGVASMRCRGAVALQAVNSGPVNGVPYAVRIRLCTYIECIHMVAYIVLYVLCRVFNMGRRPSFFYVTVAISFAP